MKEKTKEDKAAKKIDHGKVRKWKKTLMGALEHLTEKEEQIGEVLKMRVMWTYGFGNVDLRFWQCGSRVLAPGLRSRVV